MRCTKNSRLQMDHPIPRACVRSSKSALLKWDVCKRTCPSMRICSLLHGTLWTLSSTCPKEPLQTCNVNTCNPDRTFWRACHHPPYCPRCLKSMVLFCSQEPAAANQILKELQEEAWANCHGGRRASWASASQKRHARLSCNGQGAEQRAAPSTWTLTEPTLLKRRCP